MIMWFVDFVAAVDLDRLTREMDVKTLQDNIMNVTYCNIENELVGIKVIHALSYLYFTTPIWTFQKNIAWSMGCPRSYLIKHKVQNFIRMLLIFYLNYGLGWSVSLINV